MSKKIPIKKFSLRILIFSIVVAGLAALFQWLAPAYASPALPFIVLFFFVITLFTIFVVLRDDQGKDGQRFVSGYLLSRIIKLFSCLLFLFLYILINKEDAWKFGLAFIVIYFLFSIFEVLLLKKESDDITKRGQSMEEKN
ncbi:MAG: hypothetical protein IKU03_08655 [Bacteroidales bacterium]|nr:hypothetical protein [Bacteroidales bacterium]